MNSQHTWWKKNERRERQWAFLRHCRDLPTFSSVDTRFLKYMGSGTALFRLSHIGQERGRK